MITQERLKELIKQGATIYEVSTFGVNTITLKQCDYVEENGVLHTQVVVGGYKYFYGERLFETKAEAEWQAEFGCIERVERLVLPTWEELNCMDFKRFDFVSKYNGRITILIDVFDKLTIGNDDTYQEMFKATKDNYIEVCRKAKELFLGENDDR